ncbi:MAG: hypothetical protein ABI222_18490 [Opitutaceae bacterium]
MNSSLPILRNVPVWRALAVIAALILSPAGMQAKVGGQNPAGKLYVTSLEGDSKVTTDGKIVPLSAKSTFTAQGSMTETASLGTVAMVLSNGTGLSLGQGTDIEVKLFTQEPFTASRKDLEIEPSMSHTRIGVSRGTLAVSTSKLAEGSKMTFVTPLGSVNLRDGRVVIQVDLGAVKISLLEGEAIVYAGDADLSGRVVHAGEQAIIRPGAPGQPNTIEIIKIPAPERPALENYGELAYAARKTVFFETNDSGEIEALPVVNTSIPVNATVSPSRLPN